MPAPRTPSCLLDPTWRLGLSKTYLGLACPQYMPSRHPLTDILSNAFFSSGFSSSYFLLGYFHQHFQVILILQKFFLITCPQLLLIRFSTCLCSLTSLSLSLGCLQSTEPAFAKRLGNFTLLNPM